MRRGGKPAKAKVEAKLPVARKSPKNEGSRVRDLEKRLAEALEQQTATSEILSVIASSPTDVQPIFDAIVQSAVRLCDAVYSAAARLEGDLIHLVAHHNWSDEGLAMAQRLFPMPADRDHLTARAIRESRVIHVHHIQSDPTVPVTSRELAVSQGYQTLLVVPMLREGHALGAIIVAKAEGPFSDEKVALLQTFADQAVIAIENVRLFTELQEKNRALTDAHAQVSEALEQQTATSEILRVISSSPTDVQPVFDAIAAAATTLCAAEHAGVFLFDGTLIHFAAHHGWTAKDLDAIRQTFPRPPGPGTVTARAILTRAVAHTADIAADPGYELRGFVDEGFHAILSVPMLRDGDPIGAISVTRREAVPFTDRQILLASRIRGSSGNLDDCATYDAALDIGGKRPR